MKISWMLPIFVLIFVSKSFPQSYGLGNIDPSVFSRFKVPDTRLRSIWVASDLNYSSDRYSAFSSGYARSNTYFTANLRPSYYLLNETDDRYFHLNSSVGGLYRRTSQKDEGSPLFQSYHTKERTFETDVRLNTVFRSYLRPSLMFYSMESGISVQLNESVREQRATNINYQYRGQKQQSYTVSLGIGWGKMRNVTAIVSALRFQERLKQLNLITGDLGEETVQALAEQFYRHGYYWQVHVRPDKFFWQEVGKTLAKEGVSLDGINQYANSYLRETPGELRFQRNEGAVGGVGLQFVYTNHYNSNASPKISEQFLVLANAYIHYSHQLNLSSQAVFSASVSGGPNVIQSPTVRQYYAATARLGYSYELTDRLVTTVDNRFTLSFVNAHQQERYLTNTLGATVHYFVEDQLSLTGSYFWNFSDTKNSVPSGREERINNNVQIGLTYYIWRGFIQNEM